MREALEVNRATALAGLPHGFLGRRGGVSQGVVASLNIGLGSEDDPQAVAQNQRLAIDAVLPGARLATVYQVHGVRCETVTAPWPDDRRPHADAIVTDCPGILLGILTADCTPVLFADHAAGVVGAAHAGWKGALAGVTDTTIAAMEALGARRERIVAAIGPTIAQPSYEVDESFHTRFLAENANNAHFFGSGRPGHYHFDLPGYVAVRLAQAGIGSVDNLGLDTCALSARFFSYRRATLNGQADYGRQIALIGLA